jgi:hypothetical protein
MFNKNWGAFEPSTLPKSPCIMRSKNHRSQPPTNSTDEPQEDALSGGGRDQADSQVVGDIDA